MHSNTRPRKRLSEVLVVFTASKLTLAQAAGLLHPSQDHTLILRDTDATYFNLQSSGTSCDMPPYTGTQTFNSHQRR